MTKACCVGSQAKANINIHDYSRSAGPGFCSEQGRNNCRACSGSKRLHEAFITWWCGQESVFQETITKTWQQVNYKRHAAPLQAG